MTHTAAKPALDLVPGSRIHGFVVDRAQPLAEIDGTAYTLHHEKAGTPLMWLANDDENKSFSITFKTPPADDTGVFHILEHSVLCGSDRYPVKEPFVNLLKSSMQTFLNALTFSDKTMYPVASTNEQDLLNLMDVYMDAVLHPLLYTKRSIFEQEGWHYELDEEGGAGQTLRYNGVVFNEMKGALSDPEDVALNCLNASLFPDTAYRFESGGNPRAITQLTYEAFLDAHARHYNAANARIVLYGDISLERELALLDERHLAHAPKPMKSPNPLELQSPVVCLDASCTMATAPENGVVMAGYVLGTFRDRERCLATEILVDALMGSNEAPLKKKLLEADLGSDVDAFVYDGVLQPIAVFELRGAKPGSREAFCDLLDRELAQLARESVPRENLEAALESAAFGLREREFGYADGVALAIDAMGSWLYDDGLATERLRYEDALERLRAGLGSDYWERLVDDVFVDSSHRARMELVPRDEGAAAGEAGWEDDALEAARQKLGEKGLAHVARQVEQLRRAQDEPDAPEALATLPRLMLSDIGAARDEAPFGPVQGTPLPCLYHDVPTRRVDYVYHYFDLSCLSWDEIPYISLATSLLGKMATSRRSAAALDMLVESRLGRLSFSTVVHEDAQTGAATPRLVVGASALAENVDDLARIPSEIWSETDFGDTDKILRILQQQRIESEQSFTGAGNSFALSRAWGYVSEGSRLAQHFGNVDYYRFVRRLLADWDSASQTLPDKLSELTGRVFTTARALHSFTGQRRDLERFWQAGGTLCLRNGGMFENRLAVPAGSCLNEAFVVPSDICFVAKVDDRAHARAQFSGAWQVASRALGYDYLWNEIRVKGGAYGCSFRIGPNGNMGFSTYRDPNLDASFDRIDRAGAWLASFDPTPEELCGYIVSSVAAQDAPKRPRQIAQRQDVDYLTNRDRGWHGRIRAEKLGTTAEDVRSLSGALERLAHRDALCVFGSRDLIERAKTPLAVVDLFGDAAYEA